MEFCESTVLVTGGAVRIGRGIVKALHGAGCKVVIHYRNSREEALELAAELENERILCVQGSLDSEEGCVRLFREACEVSGGINVVINNASIYRRDKFKDVSEKIIIDLLRVNLIAPAILARELFAKLTHDSQGHGVSGGIINIVDTKVAGNERGCLPYLVSKKALAEATEDLAVELAPQITVNAVAPGEILPPSGENLDGNFFDEQRSFLVEKSGINDIADAILFLIGHDCITGQVLYVDSGMRLAARERMK